MLLSINVQKHQTHNNTALALIDRNVPYPPASKMIETCVCAHAYVCVCPSVCCVCVRASIRGGEGERERCVHRIICFHDVIFPLTFFSLERVHLKLLNASVTGCFVHLAVISDDPRPNVLATTGAIREEYEQLLKEVSF